MIVHSLVIQASLTGILKKSAMMATSRSPADSAADSQYPSGFFFWSASSLRRRLSIPQLRSLDPGRPFSIRTCPSIISSVYFT